MDEELNAYIGILKSEVSNLYNQRLVLQAKLTVSETKVVELEKQLTALEVKLSKKKPTKEADDFK